MNVPTRKVGAGGLGGALVVVIISIIESFSIKIDGDLASALTVLVTFMLSYFVPDIDTSVHVGQEPPNT